MHDSEISPQTGAPFGMRRELLVSPFDLPCTPPPWGVLAAVDLASGEIVWRRTLNHRGPDRKAFKLTGTPTIGGPMITAGGLVFIGATPLYLRAFDVSMAGVVKGRLPCRGDGNADDVRMERPTVCRGLPAAIQDRRAAGR
jgi:quinoprotein glucose dehydrogenase